MAVHGENVIDLRGSSREEQLAPVSLEIVVWHDGATTVVRPTGEIDLANAAELKRCIADVVEQGRADVVVDLGRVTFVDSTGLSVLVSSLKLAQRTNGRLRLAHLSGEVERVFALTGLLEVFEQRNDDRSSLA